MCVSLLCSSSGTGVKTWLWPTMWMLRTELRSSAIIDALNNRAISPAPDLRFLKTHLVCCHINFQTAFWTCHALKGQMREGWRAACPLVPAIQLVIVYCIRHIYSLVLLECFAPNTELWSTCGVIASHIDRPHLNVSQNRLKQPKILSCRNLDYLRIPLRV